MKETQEEMNSQWLLLRQAEEAVVSWSVVAYEAENVQPVEEPMLTAAAGLVLQACCFCS